MRIYTKYGDTGKTRIVGGKRLDKDDVRVESYGTIDEVCSLLGLMMSHLEQDDRLKMELLSIQQLIFDCGSDLAVADFYRPYKLSEEAVVNLEKAIDFYLDETPKVEQFILPGGVPLAAECQVLRTVTRRAERRIVTLMKQEEDVNPEVLKFVNRLSDYFFVLARWLNFQKNEEEVMYHKSATIFKQARR